MRCEMEQQLELSFSCSALPVEAISGVRITVLLCSSSEENFIEIGQTETIIGNVNPVFSRRCYVPYCFENSQKLQCVINQVDGISERFTSMIAKVECILGEVLSRGGFIKLPLFSNEGMSFLHLETHEKKLSGQAVRLQFKGHSLHTPSSGCPLNAYFMMYLVPEGATKLLLYKSEAIAEKNPVWRTFLVPISHFSFASASCFIEIDVYNYNVNHEDKLIGKCTTSFDQLLRGVGALNAYKLSSLEGKKKGNASVELVNIIQVASSSFIDYLKTGTQIHFSVAVDFTASNGNPLDPSSLHYIHPHNFNPYMTALNAVTSVIGKYNRHGRIAALGFGAQTPPDYKNGDATDPHVDGIDGVLNAYRSALLSIRPYAPTDYSEVIYHTYKFGAAVQRQGKSDHYFVLLIVTDGCVTNSKRTVNAIVDCAELPISIVIVGVGNQDFSAMQCLLSPTLKSSEGRLLRREIVTFVPYTASMTSNELVTKLLINVPRQFLTWAMMHDRFASSR
uniref:VWFA domain-containing protein n=1 Tax=Onchocerca volvulus TaxID=6282 RepID=A0A8R1TUF6_ONCVO